MTTGLATRRWPPDFCQSTGCDRSVGCGHIGTKCAGI